MLWNVIECYDEDMHIWCSSGLIGNFSKVRMTHDKHYWQSQLQVKTSSWLKLSLCPLLRVVITRWRDGSWLEVWAGGSLLEFPLLKISMLPYTVTHASPASPECVSHHPGLIWSKQEYDQQPLWARRIKHRLFNKRSHVSSTTFKSICCVYCCALKQVWLKYLWVW